MLKTALNALTSLHSRDVLLKRIGTPDIYSPCRVTPSNYFRNLKGPEYTTIKGVEFIIPIDSLLGSFAQIITFSAVPDDGDFKLSFGLNTTNDILFSATAADIQTELQALPAMQDVIVTGDFSIGFTIVFLGFSVRPGIGVTSSNTLEESTVPVTTSWAHTYDKWADTIKRGDRIVDGPKVRTVDEIMEMHDLGAETMAYRVRAE